MNLKEKTFHQKNMITKYEKNNVTIGINVLYTKLKNISCLCLKA